MRKYGAVCTIFLVAWALLAGPVALATESPWQPVGVVAQEADTLVNQSEPPVRIEAKSAVLLDADTGKVLVDFNSNERLYPASVTKVMTLLLVAEALDSGKMQLSDTVQASANAASKGGSQIWLKEGETMTVEELLKAAAIYSANDACTALAEHLAGSEAAFVEQMNRRAAALGMTNTTFVNCTGLDDDVTEHLTTAHDIALMSRALLRHPSVTRYSTVWMDTLRGGKTELVNTNRLVRFFEGATGLKTGTTSKAGCCIAASAKRGETHLIAVVLGAPNSNARFETAKRLLTWGFANFNTIKVAFDPSLLQPVRVLRGAEPSLVPQPPAQMPVLVPRGTEHELMQSVQLAKDVQAPVLAGQALGKVLLTLDGIRIAEYPLTAPHAVPKLDLFSLLKRFVRSLA